ncbi:MAG: hypothetical protein KAJ33_01475 [Thermoplasmata archaeon]|nr:hypothetical protein [Thermoplasmata archaeon]
MKLKGIYSVMAVLGLSAMLMGPALATPFYDIYVDKDAYGTGADVTVSYFGLGNDHFSVELRLVIVNDAGSIVATNTVAEVVTTAGYEWVWDQTSNYGPAQIIYDGMYGLHTGLFNPDNSVYSLSLESWDDFRIGANQGDDNQNGQGPNGPNNP